MRSIILSSVFATVTVSASAHGALLWNQTGAADADNIDQVFTAPASTKFSTYLVDDFTTGGQTWNITSMSARYAGGSGDWSGVTAARISFFAQTAPFPITGVDMPGAYTAPVTVAGDATSGYIITADLSGIGALQGVSGIFWIGMSIVTDSGTQQYHTLLQTNQYGYGARMQNPANAFGFGAGWIKPANFYNDDMWFTLEGEVAPVHACPGDLNGDGFVDDLDFVLFAGAYDILVCSEPAMPSGCPSDLNNDGLVDDADFVLFAAAYDAFLCPDQRR